MKQTPIGKTASLSGASMTLKILSGIGNLTMRCIVCGGDHVPKAGICDSEGMDREAARMGSRKWNAITGQVMREANKQLKVEITWRNDNPDTIWNVLARKLGREPTSAEVRDEIRRILEEPIS
jgi:hypothetical protein